jgi:hypothetical protein
MNCVDIILTLIIVAGIGMSVAAPSDDAGAFRRCDEETGKHSGSHEEYLNRLNGKRIVFVGDSGSRYQYLELAHYLVYGTCPDAGTMPYMLNEVTYTNWNDFYYNTSAMLSVNSGVFRSTETCFCTRYENRLSPEDSLENRIFTYVDIEVWSNHSMALIYCIVTCTL